MELSLDFAGVKTVDSAGFEKELAEISQVITNNKIDSAMRIEMVHDILSSGY